MANHEEATLLKFTLDLLAEVAAYVDATVKPETRVEAFAKANCIAAIKEFSRDVEKASTE